MNTLLLQKSRHSLKSIINHPFFGYIFFGLILLVAQLLTLSGIIPPSTMESIILTLIYSVAALGFSLLLGYAGLASLGTAGFIGLGTYLTGYFAGTLDLSFGLTILISLAGAIIIGTIVGFISLRIEGMYLAIITLGLSEILVEIFKSFDAFTNGVDGLGFRTFDLFGTLVSDNSVYIIIIIVFVIVMLATINIIKSPTGRALLAMKNSTSAAQSMGISLLKYRLLAFIISTVYAVIAGMLYMIMKKFSVPTTWNLSMSLNILAAVIVGGSQSIYGITLGMFMIYGLSPAILSNIEFFSRVNGSEMIFNGLLIILVVMFYPGGLIRLVQTIATFIKKKYLEFKQKWKEYRYGKDE